MNKKILVIEDNEQNLYLVTFILQQQGYEVVPARSGEEALQIVQTLKPCLVLLDIQLPDKDGYAVAGELLGMQGIMDVPIVAVTSYAMVGDREKVFASGCSGYIEKPINPETFVREIEEFIVP